MTYLDNWKKKLKKKLRFLEMQRHDMRMRNRQLKDKQVKDNLMLDYYMEIQPKTKKWKARKTKDIESVLIEAIILKLCLTEMELKNTRSSTSQAMQSMQHTSQRLSKKASMLLCLCRKMVGLDFNLRNIKYCHRVS